jgi:hypothetical protein
VPDVPGPGAQGDHCTDGLAGYPARDVVGVPGSPVTVPVAGVLYNAHVIPWHPGFGGYTVYMHGDDGSEWYFTHLDPDRRGPVGHVPAGTVIGWLAGAFAVAYIYVPHVHVGSSAYAYPPCSARGCSGDPGCQAGKTPAEQAGGSQQPGGGAGGPISSPAPGATRPGGEPAGQGVSFFSSVGDAFGGVFGQLFGIAKALPTAVWSIAKSVAFLIHFVTSPDNWLRLVEFLAGVGLLVFALAVFGRVFAGGDQADDGLRQIGQVSERMLAGDR